MGWRKFLFLHASKKTQSKPTPLPCPPLPTLRSPQPLAFPCIPFQIYFSNGIFDPGDLGEALVRKVDLTRVYIPQTYDVDGRGVPFPSVLLNISLFSRVASIDASGTVIRILSLDDHCQIGLRSQNRTVLLEGSEASRHLDWSRLTDTDLTSLAMYGEAQCCKLLKKDGDVPAAVSPTAILLQGNNLSTVQAGNNGDWHFVSSTTGADLGKLCLLLDKNPDRNNAPIVDPAMAEEATRPGATTCPCLESFKVFHALKTSGYVDGNGNIVLEGVPQPLYPADRSGRKGGLVYGGGSCMSHDQHLPPSCTDETGKPLANAPAWCLTSWCFVDTASCDRVNTLSAYFPASKLMYSYDTCGSEDTFSTPVSRPLVRRIDLSNNALTQTDLQKDRLGEVLGSRQQLPNLVDIDLRNNDLEGIPLGTI